MIDINYLTNTYKDFLKEATELKYFFTILNEMKAEANYLKSSSEIETKSVDALVKNSINIAKNYSGEVTNLNLHTEDVSNLIHMTTTVVNLLDSTAKSLIDYTQFPLFSKFYGDLSDEFQEISKGSHDNITAVFKDLYNAKNKYKASQNKLEKINKELEVLLTSRRKADSDEKNSYNLSMKDKLDDKILNSINEFDENKLINKQNFDECKRQEIILNDLVKDYFSQCVVFFVTNTKKLKVLFEGIIDNKSGATYKIKDLIILSKNYLVNTEIITEGIEKKYCDSKGLIFGI